VKLEASARRLPPFEKFDNIVYFVCDILVVKDPLMSTRNEGSIEGFPSESARIRALREMVREGPVEVVGAEGRRAALPGSVADLLDEILKNMQAGKAVSVVAEHQSITTQRAANILGVSRPFLVRLLEGGELPFHMVGSHRRVYLKDLLAYKTRRDEERREALNRMARMELAAGTYDKVVLPEGAEER
jgi:excisionase family DNA binding protein